jgi:hypothetical protein
MNKRQFLNIGGLGVLLVSLTFTQASAFGLKSITDAVGGGGSSGGGDWKAITEKFTGSLKELGKQAVVVSKSNDLLMAALGIKNEMAMTKKQEEDYKKNGITSDALDTEKAKTANVLKEIKRLESEGIKLSVEQKTKMGKAVIKYVPAMIKAIQATKKLSEVGSDASKAGTPGISDGTAAISAAKDIPVLVPAAISFMGNSVTASTTMFKILKAKDVVIKEDMGKMVMF